MFPLFLRYYLVLQMLFCFYFEESKGQIFINVMFEKRQTSCHQTYSKGKNSVSIQIIESDLFSPLCQCTHSVSPGFSPSVLGRRMRKFFWVSHLLVSDSHLTEVCNSWSQCNLTWSWGCGNLTVIFVPRNWAIGIYQKLKCNRQLFFQLYLCVSMIWITMFFFSLIFTETNTNFSCSLFYTGISWKYPSVLSHPYFCLSVLYPL